MAEKPFKGSFNKSKHVCNCGQYCFGCMYVSNLPLSIRVHTTLLAQCLFQLALWNIFLDIVLKKTKCGLSWSVLLSTRSTIHYSFPKHFLVLFLHIERVCKIFEKKVWRVQVAHLHNVARALSSPTRCFQLSTNLDKDFFRYLWYWMSFSVALVKFHWFGINWHVFNQSECRNYCLYIISIGNRTTSSTIRD